MNIGDLFLRARLESQSLITDAKKAGDKAGSAFGMSMSKSSARALKQGVALGAGIVGFNLLGSAIQGVSRYLQDSATAFREDERSVQKLTTSLRANAVGWDGTTDAIDKRIAAGQRLGFSDEEQRSSLAELVAAYGDVATSLDVMRIAMDLARFSGVDLATASDVLIKVHAGNYRALKALGIQTKDIKTEQQALTAIQKIAANQAEEYAQTLEGELVVAEERAAEASEKFGKQIARIQAVAIPLATDAVEGLADAFDALFNPGEKLDPEEWSDRVTGGLNRLSLGGDKVHKSVERMADTFDSSVDDARRFAARLTAIEDAARQAEEEIDGLAETITEELFGEAITAGHEAELKQHIADLRAQRAEVKRTSPEYVILAGEIADYERQLFELHLEQAEKEGPLAAIRFLERERQKAGAAKNEIDKLIQRYRTLADMQGTLGPIIVVSGRYAGKAGLDPRFLAAGGRYQKGEPRIVGEHGPELDIPDRSGYIVPNPMASTASLTAAPTASVSSSSSLAINGGIHVDARGLPNPGAVGAAVRQGIADAMADVLQSQSARLPVGTRA